MRRLVEKKGKATSVGAARLVAFRVPLDSDPELVVPLLTGPLGLRPEDPPAVTVRPAADGLLYEGNGGAQETRGEIAVQKHHMEIHSHLGIRI